MSRQFGSSHGPLFNTFTLPLIAAFVFLASSTSSANTLQFSWIDDQGAQGYFHWNVAEGYNASAISEFSYIQYDGSPSPTGFLPSDFHTFNNGYSWDLYTEPEGVDFTFDTAFTSPLPETPEVYESAFQNGNYISLTGVRHWDSLSVTVVPEPSSLCMLVVAAVILFYRMRFAPSSHRSR